jgi:hypothetical protein
LLARLSGFKRREDNDIPADEKEYSPRFPALKNRLVQVLIGFDLV